MHFSRKSNTIIPLAIPYLLDIYMFITVIDSAVMLQYGLMTVNLKFMLKKLLVK